MELLITRDYCNYGICAYLAMSRDVIAQIYQIYPEAQPSRPCLRATIPIRVNRAYVTATEGEPEGVEHTYEIIEICI